MFCGRCNVQKLVHDFHRLRSVVFEYLKQRPDPSNTRALRDELLRLRERHGKVLRGAGVCGVQRGSMVRVWQPRRERLHVVPEEELSGGVEGKPGDRVLNININHSNLN